MPVRATHTGQMNDSVVLRDFFFFFCEVRSRYGAELR